MASKIYLLNNALKKIGRGGYPQSQKMSQGYNFNTTDSIHKLHPEKFPDFKPNLNSIVLMDGATATDLISCAAFPFFMILASKKLLNILIKFKLPPNKIYPASVIHKGKNLKSYSAVHFLDPLEYLNYIDFERSRFWRQKLSRHENLEYLKLNSVKELKEEFAKDKIRNTTTIEPATAVWAEELVMKDEFYNTVDLFSLSSVTFPVHFKVTEELKLAIEKENCNGIEFEDVSSNKNDLVNPFWKKIVNTYFPQK